MGIDYGNLAKCHGSTNSSKKSASNVVASHPGENLMLLFVTIIHVCSGSVGL